MDKNAKSATTVVSSSNTIGDLYKFSDVDNVENCPENCRLGMILMIGANVKKNLTEATSAADAYPANTVSILKIMKIMRIMNGLKGAKVACFLFKYNLRGPFGYKGMGMNDCCNVAFNYDNVFLFNIYGPRRHV